MSAWITLNVQTDSPKRVADALPKLDHYIPDYDGAPDLVLYAFTSREPFKESEMALRDAAWTALENGAVTVLAMTVHDTSDVAYFTGMDRGNGQLVETAYGGGELYEDGYRDAVARIEADIGFAPDLGGNYRRDRDSDYSFYQRRSED